MITPFIEYYGKHNISPVQKLIKNKSSFFKQREYLYRCIGVVPNLLEGKNIIEFGPGNGVNAVYTFSLAPERYVLVDGNPLAIKNITENLNLHFNSLNHLEICHTLIEKFNHNPLFDFVICENVIPNQYNPSEFVKMIAKNVRDGGILFVTCNDSASILSETLRSTIGLLSTKNINDYEKKTDLLASYFSSHFKKLKHLGRDIKDWVQDNILNIRWALETNLFSISETINSLADKFTFYHSSPLFVNDMRWYKSVDEEISLKDTNRIAIDFYYKNIINLLDYRFDFSPHSVEFGKQILGYTNKVRELCKNYYNSSSEQVLLSLINELKNLSRLLEKVSIQTAESISDYAKILKTGKYECVNSLDSISSWWGRGTQNISFIKK